MLWNSIYIHEIFKGIRYIFYFSYLARRLPLWEKARWLGNIVGKFLLLSHSRPFIHIHMTYILIFIKFELFWPFLSRKHKVSWTRYPLNAWWVMVVIVSSKDETGVKKYFHGKSESIKTPHVSKVVNCYGQFLGQKKNFLLLFVVGLIRQLTMVIDLINLVDFQVYLIFGPTSQIYE